MPDNDNDLKPSSVWSGTLIKDVAMKSRGLILAGIILVSLAFLLFIYVLEAKTTLKSIPSQLTYAETIKNIGYVIAITSLAMLFWGLIALYRAKAALETIYNQRNKSAATNSDDESSISIVRFGCLNCEKRITAEFLPDKETVRCPHCGVVNLVPKEAVASAEDVYLQRKTNSVSSVVSTSREIVGMPFFIRLLAWVNLIVLSAAAVFLLTKGVPSHVDKNVYLGLGLAYAGIIVAALLFSMSAISIDLSTKPHRKAETN
jgi:hypothetical protein